MRPDGSSQVRCTPVISPSPSVTAASRAGQVSRVPSGVPGSGRYQQLRVKAERAHVAGAGDAALAQIGFRQRARDRSRHREQPPCGFRRVRRCGCGGWCRRSRFRPRQPEKASRLVQQLAALQALHRPDQVEQVAMAPLRGVGPLTGRALAGVGTAKAHIEAAPGRVVDVAGEPVAALAAAVGQVVAAHRLGVLGETARQVGHRVRHDGLR